MELTDQLIANVRALLMSSQVERALEVLAPGVKSNEDNVEFLQLFGEVLLENNDVESAYDILSKACQLDPTATKGIEKFFYMGQIIGGFEGIELLGVGLSKLHEQLVAVQEDRGNDDENLKVLSKTYTSKEALLTYLLKKLNQGIYAQIEIWMTDLCDEPEAEKKCDELIHSALLLDEANPETLSLLASIRISQQRNDDAKEAIIKSWDLFQVKKTRLEEAANPGNQTEDSDGFEIGLEYIELIQPLISLARFAIELELYEIGISVASGIQDINENILEPYYYEALSELFIAKKLYSSSNNIANDDYRELDIKILKQSKDEGICTLIKDAQLSLTLGYKIINSGSIDADPELIEQVSDLLNELGGPIMSELLSLKRNEEEDGWEDEIESDEN